MDEENVAIVAACPLRGLALHWIEIALVGEDGKPIAWERYEITLPDHAVRAGFLDQHGRARVDGIVDAGACQVTFPDLDAAAWDWFGAAAA